MTKPLTAALLIEEARKRLRARESPALDARVLLCRAVGRNRTFIIGNPDFRPSEEEISLFTSYVERRAAGEPVAYILREKEFYALDFYVDETTLIPRPDTETLVDEALRLLKELPQGSPGSAPKVLDLCCGSGAVAASVAVHRPEAAVFASDISAGALALARKNAKRNGARVFFAEADLFTLKNAADAALFPREFDIITANPPYIKTSEIAGLPPSVRDYEPVSALDGGESGLAFYERIAPGAAARLSPGGALLVELGAGQAREVCRIMENAGFADVAIKKDLSGIERVIIAKPRNLLNNKILQSLSKVGHDV
ncbi:MAG: peptide chain release factor N(5)-glutamine methyltransferase [Clostridiales bacterium]|jgi:release factor glutamine methyltransferase|nr:peptide chain release factor N(5)-glutamine methyltransferase [Clostridiales bacterium]